MQTSAFGSVKARCLGFGHGGRVLALAMALVGACWLPGAAFAQPLVLAEGVLMSTGGVPAADGDYKLTFTLWDASKDGKALWSENVDAKIVGGRFAAQLGATKAINPASLTGGLHLGVAVGQDPELPRQPLTAAPLALRASLAEGLSCSGCVSSAAAAFNYAGSATKGGPAADLACTGCVSVSELVFDADVDLGGNSLKAKNGTFSGDVVAKTVTATSFVGDGSKLTGIKTASGACADGQAVVGIAADGKLQCKAVASALPKDGVSQVSNGLLSNQFTDLQGAPQANLPIPDNTGASATSVIAFPDLGEAQGLTVAVELTNTDLSTVTIKLLPPDDKKVGFVLCDPCGEKDQKSLKASWSDANAPKTGDLATLLGKNPKGDWTLVVTDSAFCVKQAPGNGPLCDLDKKEDGVIVDWSVQAKTLSTKKVAATSSLQLLPVDTAPFACTPNHMGALYFNKKDKALRYCDGGIWRTLADTCGNGVIEAGEDCDDGNNSDGDGCSSTCKTVCGDGVVVGKEECDDKNNVDTDACSNKCVAGYATIQGKPGTSCLDILNKYAAGGGKAADGSYWIKAPKGQVLQVACDMSTEGGGYTYLPIDSGKDTYRSTDDNSCKDYGFDIVYPRSKAQWTWMLAKYGAGYFSTVPGVTKPGNGGNYTGCAMRHPGHYGSGCNDWKVPDGGRWWLRDGNYSEPNGDYDANCWLSMYKHDVNDIQFNDGSCSYHTTKYLCSTNDKN